MNCRPGDLAVVIVPGPHHGSLVSVLRAAPAVPLRLPDGVLNQGCAPAYWVVEMLGRPVRAQLTNGLWRAARFGTAADRELRPLRDSDGADETLRIAGLPMGDEVPA